MTIDVISLSIAVGAVLVALTTHIKFSKCWGFEMTTRTPLKQTPPQTPNILETQPLLQNTPAILEPSIGFRAGLSETSEPSEPINIPPRPKPKIKNWL